jgi:hypothetical protein
LKVVNHGGHAVLALIDHRGEIRKSTGFHDCCSDLKSTGSMTSALRSIRRLHAHCSALNLQAMTAAMLSFFLSFSPVYLRNPHNNTLRQARSGYEQP